ncbi:MAG: chromosome segregation protein SMC [Gammaproteobacteria bacterium]
MRLLKIKLSGFKSFADPTTLEFPEGIAAITGPNGAGKSNLIDAVRWVMGESSAKILRGESMPDVIFGGSHTRKPAGQASVELVFDNSDGRIGGDYAAYNEIAIRRVVGRDGISQYYLNGSTCRRRDITDIFLGTGLGPRSYAIIEQGTISRLVDLKPEEWQLFLEEAAGVSKYKERRRETLARVENTRERLERVNEIRGELGKRLNQLAQQARQAERFRALREAERLTRSRLCILEKQSFNEKLLELNREIREREVATEAIKAQQTRLELLLLELAERRRNASLADQEAQRHVYETEKRIAQLQSAREHRIAERDRLARDKERIADERARIGARLNADEGYLDQGHMERAALEQALEATRSEISRLGFDLRAVEKQKSDLEDHLDELRDRMAETRQRAELLVLEHKHALDSLTNLRDQQGELTRKLDAATFPALLEKREQSRLVHEVRLRERSKHETELAERKHNLDQEQASLRQAEAELNRTAIEREQAKARLNTHEQLRAQALALDGEEARKWLEKNSLHHRPRLADLLEVDPGAEPLVRAVLGNRLKAIGVERLETCSESFAALASSTVVLFEVHASEGRRAPPSSFPSLIAPGVDLDDFFAHALPAVSLADALARRQSLSAGHCFVTPDGVLVGRSWMAIDRGDPALGSVFVYDREIRSIQQKLNRLEQEHQHQAEVLEVARAHLDQSTREVMELEQIVARHSEDLLQSGAECAQLEALVTEYERQRLDWATSEKQIQEQLADVQAQIQMLEVSMRSTETEREKLETNTRSEGIQREAVRERLEELSSRIEELEARERDQHIQQEKKRFEHDAACTRIAEWKQQLESLAEEASALAQKEAEVSGVDSERTELEHALTERQRAGSRLAEARDTLQSIETELESHERDRSERSRQIEELRSHLEQYKLSAQDVTTRLSELDVRAERIHCDWSVALEDGISVTDCETELRKLEQKLERLGQVNLMATEDYETELTRKQALDQQFEDITSALATLDEAMRKIDRESQARFHETFNQVNQGLKQLFPRLFGGGYAELRLAENESGTGGGVSLYARPPGKRPASISQLSGGEKALVAIAVVFAIFNLNPAPFCMLDEVDAPMDEGSIARFTGLVRELSTRVQLILISHNRLSLESADNLVGVTMQEPGVSRLVAVSIEEAARLAAAG